MPAKWRLQSQFSLQVLRNACVAALRFRIPSAWPFVVDLPMKKVIFHIVMLLYQRVFGHFWRHCDGTVPETSIRSTHDDREVNGHSLVSPPRYVCEAWNSYTKFIQRSSNFLWSLPEALLQVLLASRTMAKVTIKCNLRKDSRSLCRCLAASPSRAWSKSLWPKPCDCNKATDGRVSSSSWGYQAACSLPPSSCHLRVCLKMVYTPNEIAI